LGWIIRGFRYINGLVQFAGKTNESEDIILYQQLGVHDEENTLVEPKCYENLKILNIV
jgi:hypothetical protein